MSGYLFVTIKHNAPSAQLPSGAHKQRSNFDQNTWSCWSSSEAPVAAHVPGFFPVEGRLHALAPQRALDRTEPQPAQPGVWKLHVGPEPAHLYLLSASHIHLAKGIQESLSGNLALSSLREVSTPCGCDANLSTAPTFPVWWQEGMLRACWCSGLCGVCVSWVEPGWNAGGSDDSLYINTYFTPVHSLATPRGHALPACLHAWWPSTSSQAQTIESVTCCYTFTIPPSDTLAETATLSNVVQV